MLKTIRYNLKQSKGQMSTNKCIKSTVSIRHTFAPKNVVKQICLGSLVEGENFIS